MVYLMHRFAVTAKALGLAGILSLYSAAGWAAGDAAALMDTVVREIDVRIQTQKKEDAWAKEKPALAARYRILATELSGLERQRDRLVGALAQKKKALAEADRKTAEAGRVREELQANLEGMVDRLDSFVAQDLPFLPDERRQRIASLKAMLAGDAFSLGEKCRRVMEALQVETEYGRGIQLAEEIVMVDGESVAAEMVRIGRLSLFFRTPDGKVVGDYDRAAGQWRRLPGRYGPNINQVAEMALRQRPVDVIALPLGRIGVP